MKYNVRNKNNNVCGSPGNEKFPCNNGVFETTDINLAYEYKAMLENTYPDVSPFTVSEIKS